MIYDSYYDESDTSVYSLSIRQEIGHQNTPNKVFSARSDNLVSNIL